MGLSDFSICVSELACLRLVGLTIRTDMSRASVECPHLWEHAFMPRMPEISGKQGNAFHGVSYGISELFDPARGTFDYTAAMVAPEALLPQGMRRIELPAGLYAGCRVPSLTLLAEAYNALYMEWAPQQAEYAVIMSAPCFERYDERFLADGSFEIFIPIAKK